MKKKFEISAVASLVDNEFVDLNLGEFQQNPNVPKVGDGFIAISYYDPTLADNSFFGDIFVFRNGLIMSTIFRSDFDGNDGFDPEHVQKITSDFKTILGEQYEPNVDESYTLDLVSKEIDPERFNRVKKFLVDNNIELLFSEDEKDDYHSFDDELNDDFKHKR